MSRFLRVISVIPVAVAFSCQMTQTTFVETREITNSPVFLRASREYLTPTSWKDDEQTFDHPVSFTIPAVIPVVQGNSGNHRVEFWYRDTKGQLVNCDYLGGSDEPHPTTAYQRALGLQYVFDRCSNGLRSGSPAQGTWFKLHVRVGDQHDPIGRTTVELRLGGSSPVLDPPLSAAESVAIRDAFSWQNTSPVPETNAEGYPALYYALIYLERREQLDALDQLSVHHSSLPIFAEELRRWDNQAGFFLHESDGQGVFEFTLIPGAVYNLLRQFALEDKAAYRVIQLRPIPVAAQSSDGSVSYAALRASGFRYMDRDPPTQSVAPHSRDRFRQALFGSFFHAVVNFVAETTKEAILEVFHGIGEVDRFIGGSVNLNVTLNVGNTDPGFSGPMQRAWGSTAGQDVKLPGVRLRVFQHALGVVPTVFLGATGDSGAATIKVAKNTSAVICVETQNDAAEITSFLTEIAACDFRFPSEMFNTDVSLALNLRQSLFNVLAQATEGRAYLQQVVGYTPHSAIILVGPLTEPWNLFNSAITPCFGFADLSFDRALLLLATAGAAVGGPAVASAIMSAASVYAVDVILGSDMQTVNGMRADAAKDSRGVATHEYGHFALCSMMYDEHPWNLMTAYAHASAERIGDSPPITNQAGYINEAFADYFASQVAGGTNNFSTPNNTKILTDPDPSSRRFVFGPVNYCSLGESCLDLVGIVPINNFSDQTQRIASLLHDAFDGWRVRSNNPAGEHAWDVSTPNNLVFAPSVKNGRPDENIQLYGKGLRELIHHWNERSTLLSDASVLGGLSDTMVASGYSWCDRCKLFALHQERDPAIPPGAAGNERLCSLEPIRTFIGTKPPGDFPCGVTQLSGVVLHDGSGVANATVIIAGPDSKVVTSDITGAFQLGGLRPGSYSLRASATIDGKLFIGRVSIRVGDGQATNVAINLGLNQQSCGPDSPNGCQITFSGDDPTVDHVRIDQPVVDRLDYQYDAILLEPGDQVTITAGGCVQTGGWGDTWKRYLDPSGPNSDRLYKGTVTMSGGRIPGVSNEISGVKLSDVQNVVLELPSTASVTPLTFGYIDDDYGDNGYDDHDDGTDDQCVMSNDGGPAHLDIAIKHGVVGG